MTAHDCRSFDPSCWRCDLTRAEMEMDTTTLQPWEADLLHGQAPCGVCARPMTRLRRTWPWWRRNEGRWTHWRCVPLIVTSGPTIRREPLRWLLWLIDEALDRVPSREGGRWYRKGGWGCRLRLHRWWWPNA